LLAAIDKGSLTKAGRELGYTQSYLTQTMKAFEEEIGFPLLVKTNRGVEPTNEARMLLPEMRRLIRCEEKLIQEMAEIHGLHRGTIRIGSFVSTSVYWVPQILEYFQNNYPEVVFQIEELGHDEMIAGLVDGSLDMALMSEPENVTSIDFIPVIEDPMMVAFSKKHDLSAYDYVPTDVLKEYPFIMTYKSYDKDPHKVFEDAGFIPEVKYHSKDDFAVLSMVQRGLGLAILP
jgi:DNA-binding transcriptional LysR family regulator